MPEDVESTAPPAELQQLQSELAEAHKTIADLEAALANSREIGVAIGILVNQRRINPDAAFHLLRHKSHRVQRKLRDVAADLVLSGDLDLEQQ